MKKALLILFVLITVSASGQNKVGGYCVKQTTPGADNLSWENDSINFIFYPSLDSWFIIISNKTSSSMTCLWDETLFVINGLSSPVIFNTTLNMNIYDPKGTSLIASQSTISKTIYPLNNYYAGQIHNILKRRDVKTGDVPIRMIFPILIGDNKVTYEFSFIAYDCEKNQ